MLLRVHGYACPSEDAGGGVSGFYNAVLGQLVSAETTIPARAAAVRNFYSNRFAKWGVVEKKGMPGEMPSKTEISGGNVCGFNIISRCSAGACRKLL